MTRFYEPELGQWVFGNPTGAYDFDSLDGSQVMEECMASLNGGRVIGKIKIERRIANADAEQGR